MKPSCSFFSFSPSQYSKQEILHPLILTASAANTRAASRQHPSPPLRDTTVKRVYNRIWRLEKRSTGRHVFVCDTRQIVVVSRLRCFLFSPPHPFPPPATRLDLAFCFFWNFPKKRFQWQQRRSPFVFCSFSEARYVYTVNFRLKKRNLFKDFFSFLRTIL